MPSAAQAAEHLQSVEAVQGQSESRHAPGTLALLGLLFAVMLAMFDGRP